MTRLIAREMAGSAPPKTPPPALPGTGWLLLGEMAFGVPDFIFWLKHRILDDLCAHSLAAPPDGDIPPLDAQDVWMALVIDAAIDNEGLTPALLPRLREGLGKASLGFWPQYLGLEMLVRSGIKLSALPGDLAHELKGWSLINAERYKIGLSPGMLTAEGDQGSVLGRRLTRADIPEWHRHLLPVEIIAPREDAGDEPALQVPPVQQDKSIADIDAMPRRAGPAKGWMGQGAPPADLDSLPQTRQSDKNTRRK